MLVKLLDVTGYYSTVSDIIVEAKLEALAQEQELEEDTGNNPVWSPGAPEGPQEINPSSDNPTQRSVLENLSNRRKELEKWAASIAMKENILNATENKINQKMDELRSLQLQVGSLLKQYDDKEREKIHRMVKIYESMKPQSAAAIFERMNMELLMEIISYMKEVKAAPILAKLQPERAKQVSERLLLKNRLPEQ